MKEIILLGLLCIGFGVEIQAGTIVYYSANSIRDDVFGRSIAEMERISRELDIDLKVVDAQYNGLKQYEDLANILAEKPDGVIVSTNSAGIIRDQVDRIKDAGIPIVSLFYRYGDDIPHFGVDERKATLLMADWIRDNYREGANIALILGREESLSQQIRTSAFLDFVDASGGSFKIVAQANADWDRLAAFSMVQNILTSSDPLPDLVVAQSDDMALGASLAIRYFGIPEGRIKVVGFSATLEGVMGILDSSIVVTVEDNIHRQIRNALTSLNDHMLNKAPIFSKLEDPYLITYYNIYEAHHSNQNILETIR